MFMVRKRNKVTSHCFRETLARAKAVVVIGFKMEPTLPLLERMLPYRSPSTLFVYYGRESPSRHAKNTNQTVFRDLFNISMTYRRDSDIYRPYEFIERLEDSEGELVFPMKYPNRIIIL